MRARRPANLEATLQQVSAAIVHEPQARKGVWAGLPQYQAKEVRLDLGCGKGTFLVAAAQAEPDVLFVGLDNSDICVANAARKVLQAGVQNAFVVHADAARLHDMFAPGELSRIYLNFNTPFPKKKHAGRRLTHIDYLAVYRRLLAEGGFLEIRTDNEPYWLFTLEELAIAGYDILRITDDMHASPIDELCVMHTEYDARTVAKGARVRALWAKPGVEPARMEQTAHLGLTEYLPKNLDELDVIPYGMEETVENWRNRDARIAAKRRRNAGS